ncbi:MAG TPA: hypothetical protein PKC72_07070 [Chitinophagaceae bacterium]|nr:hypothetical protein [Chitinophagaceae bacterium]
MKRKFIITTGFLIMVCYALNAQKTDAAGGGGTDEKNSKLVFKSRNSTEDRELTLDILSTGNASFSVSNTSDGTVKSYEHALRITVPLTVSNKKEGSFQLVFYKDGENMPYAVNQEPGMTTIYYPLSVYDEIKQKLEQAIAAKKKVQLKVVQRTAGYREATLIF